MAHNIHSMFSVREVPWHKLGEVVENAPTSEEAIKLAGLDWEVGIAEAYANIKIKDNIAGGEFISKRIPQSFATYRKDNNAVFGNVGGRYHVLQNHAAFDFFDSIVGEGQAIYETAGALLNGEIVWVLAKLPDYIKVKDDDVNKYLLLTNRHDGKGAINVLFTPVRVVCNNTLTYALDTKNKDSHISIRHTKSSADKLKEAARVLEITNSISSNIGSVFGKMADIKVNREQAIEYIKEVFPVPIKLDPTTKQKIETETSTRLRNLRNTVWTYFHDGPGQDTDAAKDTLFGLYNAVTGYYQNVKKYDNAEDQALSMFFDGGFDTMKKAYVAAVARI